MEGGNLPTIDSSHPPIEKGLLDSDFALAGADVLLRVTDANSTPLLLTAQLRAPSKPRVG